MADRPGARRLTYERGQLLATVHLWRPLAGSPQDGRTFSVSVRVESPPPLFPGLPRRRVFPDLIGAAVGGGVAALAVGVGRRRAGRSRGRDAGSGA